MRHQKGLILTTVFIMATCYFSFISFGDTAKPAVDSVSGAGMEEAEIRQMEKTGQENSAEAAFWQTNREEAMNDLVYRGGMNMDAGTSLNIILPQELDEEAEQIDVAVFNLKTGREVYRKEDCSAGDTLYWKSMESGRYHVVAFLKIGDQTESVGLDEYALLEVQDSGGRVGGVIPL